MVSDRLTFKVNNYYLDADSAVIFDKKKRFEAYGNVIFRDLKYKRISADRTFYRQENHIINFSDNVNSFLENSNIGETNSSASYDVAQ